MSLSPPVRPFICCYPIMGESHDQLDEGIVEEEVDPKMAMLGEPIVGIERVVSDDATGSGAIPALVRSEGGNRTRQPKVNPLSKENLDCAKFPTKDSYFQMGKFNWIW